MESPVPSLEDQVAHTRELYDNFTIYNRTPVSANATPKYTLVDVHHGILSYKLAILTTDRSRPFLHRWDPLWEAKNLADMASD